MKLGRFEISTDNVVDLFLRKNFENVVTFLNENVFNKADFRFFTFTARAAGSFTVPHNLPFQPKDVIMLSVLNPDTTTVTWQYDSFNNKTVKFTVSGPCTIRCYIGRYKES